MCAWKVFKVLSQRAHFSLALMLQATNDLCRYGCTVIGEENPQNALGFLIQPSLWLRHLGWEQVLKQMTSHTPRTLVLWLLLEENGENAFQVAPASALLGLKVPIIDINLRRGNSNVR